jgi:hypothetical protein
MEKRIVTLILLCLFIFPLFAESERIVILGDGTYVSTCRDSLVQRSFDGGITWNPFPDGLPEKHIYPFKIKEYRYLSSIFCHEASGYMVACGSNFVSLYVKIIFAKCSSFCCTVLNFNVNYNEFLKLTKLILPFLSI